MEPGGVYDYRLEAVDVSGASEMYGPVRATVPGTAGVYSLAPARPNPSGGTVTFAFTTGEAGRVTLSVYDIAGRLVATAYEGPAEVGETTLTADLALAPGVYVYELKAGEYKAARKMVVVE